MGALFDAQALSSREAIEARITARTRTFLIKTVPSLITVSYQNLRTIPIFRTDHRSNGAQHAQHSMRIGRKENVDAFQQRRIGAACHSNIHRPPYLF